MKIIFCDVDGVLNNAFTRERSPNGYTGVKDELIGNLGKIVEATQAKIVLSSDWRLVRDMPVKDKDYQYLVSRLKAAAGLEIFDHTDDISWRNRGEEIWKYLEDHAGIIGYVVLDDLPFRDFAEYDLLPHLVLTDQQCGLTDEDVDRAIRILNNEEVEAYDPAWF